MNTYRRFWAVLALLVVALLSPITACTATPQAPVSAPRADKPVVTSFTASASSINAGQPVTLSWNVTGAKSVAIDPGVGAVSANGTKQVSPSATTTYTLSATNDAGGTVSAVKVTVLQVVTPPDLVITNINTDGQIITYRVKNLGGNATAGSQTYLYIDDRKVATDFIEPLAAGQERTEEFSNYSSPLAHTPSLIADSGGDNKRIVVKVCADAEKALNESNAGNNCSYINWGPEFTYDFVKNAPLAEWRSNTGKLTWPMVAESTAGAAFVFRLNPLEDGSIYYMDNCLAMYPRQEANGILQGIYGEVYSDSASQQARLREVELPQRGKFTARLGFAQGADKTNGVKVSFGVVDPTGTTVFLKSADVSYDGRLDNFEVDLNNYAGKKVFFVLRVEAKVSAQYNWFVWVDPMITQY